MGYPQKAARTALQNRRELAMQRAYAKRQIAHAHLARALTLFIEEDDYLCAITLAGVADEIYGKLYRAKVAEDATTNCDREHKADPRASIDHEVDGMQAVGAHFGEKIERTDAIASLNSARDAMKHHTAGGDPATLDAADEAAQIIDRAVRNVTLLDGNYPGRIGEFDAKRRRIEQSRQIQLKGL
jgi:hypothetical protein